MWDERFIVLAEHIATWSKDRSTKVGCVIVGPAKEIVSVGYNGFPRGCNDDISQRHERPTKYLWSEHAERNAIYNAARVGVSVKDCVLYTTLFPCTDCARAIIQCGINKIIYKRSDDPRWEENFRVSKEILDDVGVLYKHV